MNTQQEIDLIKEHLATGRPIQLSLPSGRWYAFPMDERLPNHLPRECFRIAPEEPVKEFKMPEGGFWVRAIDQSFISYWPTTVGLATIWIMVNGVEKKLDHDTLQAHYKHSHTRREDDWHSF